MGVTETVTKPGRPPSLTPLPQVLVSFRVTPFAGATVPSGDSDEWFDFFWRIRPATPRGARVQPGEIGAGRGVFRIHDPPDREWESPALGGDGARPGCRLTGPA